VRPLAVTLLALFALGCGHGYRVEMPSGWDDETRAYARSVEEEMNGEAPPWAHVDVQLVWRDEHSRTVIVAATLSHPPPAPLRALARRMIRVGNEKVINFELRREPTAVRVDGAPAVIYDYSGSPSFGAVEVRIVLIRHANSVHVVALTATPHGFQEGSSRLAEMLDSWRWERPGSVDQPLLHPVHRDAPQGDGEGDQEHHAQQVRRLKAEAGAAHELDQVVQRVQL
jgi:hypothetical protein